MSSPSDRVAVRPTVDATEELLRLLSVSASTGALEVDDVVSGTVYLIRGRVSFVEAVGVPDLGTRLTRAGVVPEQEWRAATTRAGAEMPGSAVAARRELIASSTSRGIVLSSVLDAAAALIPGTESGRSRFHPGRRHWAAGLVSLDPDALLDRVRRGRREAESVTGRDIPRLCAVPPDVRPVLDAADWPLITRIDGRTTIAGIAWEDGAEVLALSAGVARLVRSGICAVQVGEPLRAGVTPTLPVGRTSASVVGPVPQIVPPPASSGPVEQGAPLPRRRRGASQAEVGRAALPRRHPVPGFDRLPAPGEQGARAPLVGSGRFVSPKDPALLQRLLDGLRRLD